PGDLVVEERGGESVEVAVAVHVRRGHSAGAGGRERDGVTRPVDARSVALVPGDLLVVLGGGENVEVAVSVQIRREHRTGAVGGERDRVDHPARAVTRRKVLVP